jgi:hypothetical protein
MQPWGCALQVQLLTGTIDKKPRRNFTNASLHWPQANEFLVKLLKNLRNT